MLVRILSCILYWIHNIMSEGLMCLVCVIICSTFSILISSWFIRLNHNEKLYIKSILIGKLKNDFMRVGKKIIFSLISIIVALIAIFSVYIYVSVPIPSNSQNKIVQISFDDVYLCIKDLKDTLRYTSVFQQPFFKSLKELHDVYGAVFSLYVYEKADNFVITEVPDKFRNEFIENSEWLKFGYHAIEPRFDKKEQSLEFERSFLNVRKSILHWAGKSSLAPCLRLHYYFADDSMIAILKKYKVYHLLGADDEGRISYNLNRLQSDSLYARRAYIYMIVYTIIRQI